MLHGFKSLFSREPKTVDTTTDPKTLVSLSKESLSFSNGTALAMVGKELKDSFDVTNISKEKLVFNVQDIVLANKYILTVSPKTAKIKPGQTARFDCSITIHCSMTVDAQLPAEVIHKNGIVKIPALHVKVLTALSTSLDIDDVVKKSGPYAYCTCGGLVHGTYRGQDVTIFEISQQTDLTRFRRDIDLWDSLRSNYLLSLTGAVFIQGSLLIVAESNQLGPLSQFRPANEFSLAMQLKCGLDCALAIWAIHSSSHAYLRLRPENVLMVSPRVEASEMCKLILYASSPDRKFSLSSLEGCTDEIDRPSYSAPEILSGDSAPSLAADLYSLAMLMIYLMVGHDPMPLDKLPTGFDVAQFTLSGQRVEIPSQCPPEVANLLKQCLVAEPEKRPTIGQFTDVLRSAVDGLTAKPSTSTAAAAVPSGGLAEEDDLSNLGAGLDI